MNQNIHLSAYDIVISNEVKDLNKSFSFRGYDQFLIFVDENTRAYCLPKLLKEIKELEDAVIIEIPVGEQFKTLDTCQNVWKTLFKKRISRNALWVNVGGGVISDMGGWIASSYKRGMDFINLPTTLLSQVDATIGGKLGINFDGIKNAIGLFKDPTHVFVYPGFLSTLEIDQMLSGFAEMLKHGLIADKKLWKLLIESDPFNPTHLNDLIYRSVLIKKKIVEQDPLEKNVRKLLNFGHTVGHAIESAAFKKKRPMLHGHAVAFGMVAEAWLSTKLSGLKEAELYEVADVVSDQFKNHFDKDLLTPALIKWMYNDKKNAQENFKFTLLKSIGKGGIDFNCSEKDIKEAIGFTKSYLK